MVQTRLGAHHRFHRFLQGAVDKRDGCQRAAMARCQLVLARGSPVSDLRTSCCSVASSSSLERRDSSAASAAGGRKPPGRFGAICEPETRLCRARTQLARDPKAMPHRLAPPSCPRDGKAHAGMGKHMQGWESTCREGSQHSEVNSHGSEGAGMGKHMQGKPAAWNRRSSHSAAEETATTAIVGGEE